MAGFESLIRNTKVSAMQVTKEFANAIYELSQDKVVVRTGNLKRSGEVGVRDNVGIGEFTAYVRYNAPYSTNVNNNRNSEGYMFLDNAVLEASYEFQIQDAWNGSRGNGVILAKETFYVPSKK